MFTAENYFSFVIFIFTIKKKYPSMISETGYIKFQLHSETHFSFFVMSWKVYNENFSKCG